MTLYIAALHRLADTASAIVPLVQRGLDSGDTRQIVDLCSGAGGPMVEVVRRLKLRPEYAEARLTLTDLYPNQHASEGIDQQRDGWLSYCQKSVDASNIPRELTGMRTMICSLHHMPPVLARSILMDAAHKKQPFLAFELSDNSPPIWMWWVAIPVGFLLTLVLTFRVRPLTVFQLIFTYLIPVVPLFIAWDGAVSNARTYTQQDLQELLSQIDSSGYHWEIGTTTSRALPGKMSYILGVPRASN